MPISDIKALSARDLLAFKDEIDDLTQEYKSAGAMSRGHIERVADLYSVYVQARHWGITPQSQTTEWDTRHHQRG